MRVTEKRYIRRMHCSRSRAAVSGRLSGVLFLHPDRSAIRKKGIILKSLLRMRKAAHLQEIICSFQIDAKIVLRKKSYVVYVKEGAQIVDMLAIMEANVALMNLENIRILKEMRNSVNRKVNCETANINKTVNAAVKQIEDIRLIEQKKGFHNLNEGLAEIAELRLQYPEATLKELGMMLNPQVGKSGVNHRLRKLSEIADELRMNEEDLL